MADARTPDDRRSLATEAHEARLLGDGDRADGLLLRARDRAQRDDVVESFLAEFLGGAMEAAGGPTWGGSCHRAAVAAIRAARGPDAPATRAAEARWASAGRDDGRYLPLPDALARALDEARRTGGDSHGLGVALARARLHAGDLGGARAAALAALELGESAAARIIAAEASGDEGALDAARGHLDAAAAATRNEPEAAELLVAQARVDLAAGHQDAAAARLDRAMALHDANLGAWHLARLAPLQLRSRLYRERGAFAPAETLLLAALHVAAIHDWGGMAVELWLDLVELELARGHVTRARACLGLLGAGGYPWCSPAQASSAPRYEALTRAVDEAERRARAALPDGFAADARAAAAVVGAAGDAEAALRALGRAAREGSACPADALAGGPGRLLYDLWRRAPRDPDLVPLVWPLAGVLPAADPELVPGPWWRDQGRLARDEAGSYDRRTGLPLFCRRLADGALMALVPALEGEPYERCFLVDLRPVTFGLWHRFGCATDGLTLGLDAEPDRPVFCVDARQVRRFLARVGAALPDRRTWRRAVLLEAAESGAAAAPPGLGLLDVSLPDPDRAAVEVVREVLYAWEWPLCRGTWTRALDLHGLAPTEPRAARVTPRFRRLRPFVPFLARIERALLQRAAPSRERRLGWRVDLLSGR